MKLVMTLLVRDAESLLRHNLDFHLRQGVDFFVITDNCSVDGTREIIEAYARMGVAERIWEPGDDFSQGLWVTRMARRAAEAHGADWIIHNDDDEFWFSRTGGLKDALGAAPPDAQVLAVERFNHPSVQGVRADSFLQGMVYRERTSMNFSGRELPPKICHRPMADIEICQGNHQALRNGEPLAAARTDALEIAHFPIRDFASFRRKIVLGGAALERNVHLPKGNGMAWRRLYELEREGRLGEWFERNCLGPEEIEARLRAGELLHDDHVARELGLLDEAPAGPAPAPAGLDAAAAEDAAPAERSYARS